MKNFIIIWSNPCSTHSPQTFIYARLCFQARAFLMSQRSFMYKILWSCISINLFCWTCWTSWVCYVTYTYVPHHLHQHVYTLLCSYLPICNQMIINTWICFFKIVRPSIVIWVSSPSYVSPQLQLRYSLLEWLYL